MGLAGYLLQLLLDPDGFVHIVLDRDRIHSTLFTDGQRSGVTSLFQSLVELVYGEALAQFLIADEIGDKVALFENNMKDRSEYASARSCHHRLQADRRSQDWGTYSKGVAGLFHRRSEN